MNDLEKKSFYSFLALYLISSFLFILFSSYWYYSSQKISLESETYYKLNHIADRLSGKIINAQMKGLKLALPQENGYEYELIKTDNILHYQDDYFEENKYKVLVSSAPQEHLNIRFVIVKTMLYFTKLQELQKRVLLALSTSFFLIIIISYFLAKLFMKPVHQRIQQIENFLQDVTHELNTPITALGMSSSRAIKKEVYDKKILTNISISTKQLESIYKSLIYLNFSDTKEEATLIEFAPVVKKVIHYYSELSCAKGIKIQSELEDTSLVILENRAELLVSNLLSNAIKYSMPESTITITLKDNILMIKDEGVGIAQEKLDVIFELYKRDTNIAGGFGIGLSIVKQICDEYKIRVEVTSTLGVGSEFLLYL